MGSGGHNEPRIRDTANLPAAAEWAGTSAFAVSIGGPVPGQRAVNSSEALSRAAGAEKPGLDAIFEVRSGRSRLAAL